MATQKVSDAQVYAMSRSILGREPDLFKPGKGNDFLGLAKKGYTEKQIYALMQKELSKLGRQNNTGIFKPNSKFNQSLAKKYSASSTTAKPAKVVKGTAITGNAPQKIPTVKQALDNKYTTEKNVETAKKNFEKSEEKKTMSFMEYLQKEESGLYNRLQKAIAGQEELPEAYQRIAAEENIPGIQQQLGAVQGQVSDVSSLLDTLEEDVNTRTSPFIMNEAQRRRQLAAEGDPLRTSLGRLTAGQTELSQQLATASGNVSNKMGYLTQQQQQNLEPLRTEIAAFSERAAREMTGFTNDKQVRLNNLLDAINAGRTLSNDQYLLANQLASEERAFNNQLELNKQTYQQNLGLQAKEFDYNKQLQELANKGGSGSGSTGLSYPINLNQTPTTTDDGFDAWFREYLSGLNNGGINQSTVPKTTVPTNTNQSYIMQSIPTMQSTPGGGYQTVGTTSNLSNQSSSSALGDYFSRTYNKDTGIWSPFK